MANNPMIEYDHAVIRCNDLKVAERFYGRVFSEIYGADQVEIDHRATDPTEAYLHTMTTGGTGWRVQQADTKQGINRHGDGTNGQDVRVVGANAQGSVKIGGALMPIFLARRHEQEPPPEQLRGTPRHAFPATEEQLAKAMEVLRKYDVDFQGPVEYPAPSPTRKSIYFKDPSSNFLELAVPREAEAGISLSLARPRQGGGDFGD